MEESFHEQVSQDISVLKPDRDMLSLLHIGLFSASISVNKYVLSELNFTYPTIFQGWQTLVGALLLHLMVTFGKLSIDLNSITKEKILPWLPVMFLHILSIYSGSVALSKMAIPYFVCFQNGVQTFPAMVKCVKYKQCHVTQRFIPQMLIFISCFMLYYTDIQKDSKTYMWLTLHVLSAGAIVLYESLQSHKIQLSDLEKIYVNNVFSFLMLAPFSYFLGDALAAQNFKFWYYYRFYIGCVLSGVFGLFLNLTMVKLKEGSVVIFNMDVAGIAKVIAATVSVFIFPFHISGFKLLWLALNMLSGVLLHSFQEGKAMEKGQQGESHEIYKL